MIVEALANYLEHQFPQLSVKIAGGLVDTILITTADKSKLITIGLNDPVQVKLAFYGKNHPISDRTANIAAIVLPASKLVDLHDPASMEAIGEFIRQHLP